MLSYHILLCSIYKIDMEKIMLSEEKKLENEKSLWITVIGVLGFLIVFVVGGILADSENSYAPTVIWFGLFLFVYYMFLYVGSARFVKAMAGEWGSKLAFSFLIAILLVESNRQASVDINAVFGISASAFSGTQTIMTMLNAFVWSKVLLSIMAVWGVVSFVYFFTTGGVGTHRSFQTFLFSISGLVIGGIGLLLVVTKFGGEEVLRKKIYLIAHSFDFNSNVKCQGNEVKGAAVFLGQSQDRVFVDETVPPEMTWLQAVYADADELKNVELPTSQDLKIYKCL